MRVKNIKFIVMLYSLILTAGLVFYYLIPKENFVKALTLEQLQEIENDARNIEVNKMVLDQSELEKKYKAESWSFDYKGDNLEIDWSNEGNRILVERKNTDDNKVEVYNYSSPMIYGKIDFSSKFKKPDVQLSGNKLTINNEKQEYSYTEFLKDFSITQFLENDTGNETESVYERRSYFNQYVIYIKVPKGLKLSEDKNIQYINK